MFYNKGILDKSIIVLFFIAGLNSCSDSQEQKAESKKPVVPITKLVTLNTSLEREYVGDLRAYQNIEIRARIPGYLESIYVDEGKEVKKGQILFKISDAEYVAGLRDAKAKLKTAIAESKTAQLELERVRILVEKKVVSTTELEVSEAKFEAIHAAVESAESALSNAQTRLNYTSIRAPFDGIVDRIPSKIGSLIEEGTLLTTLSDNRSIYAYFNVSESEYLEFFRATQKSRNAESKRVVDLILADGTEYNYPGVIETMEGEFEATTGSIAFRAKFPNPDKLLKHGSTGTILLRNVVKNALMVPQKATFEIQDKHFVYVVNEKNVARLKSFKPKSRWEDYYIVESGLAPGEKIIYEGVQKVQDGMQITPNLVEDSTNNLTTMVKY